MAVRIRAAVLVLAVATMLSVAQSSAQTYPAKPVKIIVPFAAGGPADLFARQLGQLLF